MARGRSFTDDELLPLVGLPLQEIAGHFGCDISTASRRKKALQEKMNLANAIVGDGDLDDEIDDDEDLDDGISGAAPGKVSIWETHKALEAGYKRAQELLNPTKYVLSNRERIAAERLIKDYMVASVKLEQTIYNVDEMRALKRDFLDVLKEHAPPELARHLLAKFALRHDRRRAAG